MSPNGKCLRGRCIVAYACYVLYYYVLSFAQGRGRPPGRNLLGQSYRITYALVIVMITIGYYYCVLVKERWCIVHLDWFSLCTGSPVQQRRWLVIGVCSVWLFLVKTFFSILYSLYGVLWTEHCVGQSPADGDTWYVYSKGDLPSEIGIMITQLSKCPNIGRYWSNYVHYTVDNAGSNLGFPGVDRGRTTWWDLIRPKMVMETIWTRIIWWMVLELICAGHAW